MTPLLPDYPVERKAFCVEIQAAKTLFVKEVRNEFPDIALEFRLFKTFWFPTPTDMSATLHVRFDTNKLCDVCRHSLEQFISNMRFKINNKITCGYMSSNCTYMCDGLAAYELTFYYNVSDYNEEFIIKKKSINN
jgi:hypothetical protein